MRENMKPNIVVFMTDQQNASTISPDSPVKTPNMDRFLNQSIHFTESYTTSPHCCPSRAAFFTGLYPSQHGVWHNVEVDNAISRGVFDDVSMFPEDLKKLGYNTFFSGKWHVSAYEGPLDRGFDEVLREYISNYGRMKPKNQPVYNDWLQVYNNKDGIDSGDEIKSFGRIIKEGYPSYFQFGIEENPFGDTNTVELACEKIKGYDEDDPFFMYIGTTGPHDPYMPPFEYLEMYDIEDIELPMSFYDDLSDKPNLYKRTKERFELDEQEHKESIRRYYAFCSYEDALFGKVLDTLEEKKMMEDTIIIFLTDHGDYMGAHGLWAKGLPCFKEAYNICTVIGGGGIDKGINDEFISITDFAPTILELAGSTSENKMTGKSLLPFLKGEKPKDWRNFMHTQTNGNELLGIQRAVWNKHVKYVYNGFDYDELYDLVNDPLEMKNIIDCKEAEELLKPMVKEMWRFAEETKDNVTCPYIMVSLAPFGPGIIHS